MTPGGESHERTKPASPPAVPYYDRWYSYVMGGQGLVRNASLEMAGSFEMRVRGSGRGRARWEGCGGLDAEREGGTDGDHAAGDGDGGGSRCAMG